MKRKVYQQIASTFNAWDNCLKSKNTEWVINHRTTIEKLMRESAPSGSGIDRGTQFNFDTSTGNKLVFIFEFHHMNDNGMYDGWTAHKLIVTPSLQFGIRLHITGKDKNYIKEYLYEIFQQWLESETEL